LTGATPEATATFEKAVAAIVRKNETSLSGARACKDPAGANPATGDLSITYEGEVYQGRYASVTLLAERARPHCANLDYTVPASITLDLVTGKRVKLSRFVHANGTQFDSAVIASMRTKTQNPDCYKDKKLRRVRPPLTTPQGWNVTEAGVRIWYRGTAEVGKACAYLTALVPWSSVLPPSAIADRKTRTTYWVFDLAKAAESRYGYTGKVAVVRLRGSQVVLYEWNLTKATGSCRVGVRTGSSAIVFEAGKAKAGKKVAMNNATAKAVPKKYIKQGRKATAGEIEAIFTRTHGLNAKSITRACKL
jgi:hypothetical protein